MSARERDLPSTWLLAPLSDLGTWSGGGTPSKTHLPFWKDGSIPWVSPKDMKVERIHDSEDHITEEALRGGATKLIPSRSVLFVTRSGILAHTFPIAVTTLDVTVNQDLRALTPHVGLSPDYLAWGARSLGDEILRRCSKDGTTVASIDTERLMGFELPIAPVAEQHRIVEAIESYFSRLDDAVAVLARVRRNLKRYRASVLKAAIEGRLVPTEAELARAQRRDYEPAAVLLKRILTERRRSHEARARGQYIEPIVPDTNELPKLPDGWCWTTVDAVGDVLLGRQRAPQYLTGRWPRPYLRVANIKDDAIDSSDIEEMDFDKAHFEKYRLEPGDILVSEGQSPELLGQSAIYHGGIDGLCFQKTLHRFRPVPGGPSTEFAQIVFRAHVKTGVFKRMGSITTNIAHLTLVKFKAAPFPLPPEAEQARIVAEAERLLTIAEAVDSSLRKQVARARRVRQSILKWAFEGRLAEQRPDDEPASALLERIKIERGTAGAARKSVGHPRRFV
jgi:type I restriction enzyme, S subunit